MHYPVEDYKYRMAHVPWDGEAGRRHRQTGLVAGSALPAKISTLISQANSTRRDENVSEKCMRLSSVLTIIFDGTHLEMTTLPEDFSGTR